VSSYERVFCYAANVGLLDDPTDPHALENLRRSIAMLSPGQMAGLDRERALLLLQEVQNLRRQQERAIAELHGVLRALEQD
jgi:hypothetical protein